jgi:Flp pilus assembly protein TadD
LVKQGKLADAELYYRRSLGEKPSATVHADLGVVLRKLGRTDEAADQFRKALALDATQQKARRNLAAIEAEK